jgi:Uncharacterized conserved protein
MQLAVPRYTQRPLPGYRYVPTKNPHPVIDPKGHSYQKKEEKIEFLPPERWRQNEFYLYGVDLFNYGFWWEAHEAWETVWMTTPKTDLMGQYLQGLIQFSAGLLKLFSGSERGFQNLRRESMQRIRFCLNEMKEKKIRLYMGLDLAEWVNKVEVFCGSLESSEGESVDALHFASFPALILES